MKLRGARQHTNSDLESQNPEHVPRKDAPYESRTGKGEQRVSRPSTSAWQWGSYFYGFSRCGKHLQCEGFVVE